MLMNLHTRSLSIVKLIYAIDRAPDQPGSRKTIFNFDRDTNEPNSGLIPSGGYTISSGPIVKF